MLDLTLFPKKEEWGTGDEAMDNKLFIALKKCTSALSFDSICEFYFLGLTIKPRAYNPSFQVTIELVTKALFHLFNPNECVDYFFKQMKGHYFSKNKLEFLLDEKIAILTELKNSKKYRYKNQIDFSINLQNPRERNPYIRAEIMRSTNDLSAKIIFKDFRSYLNRDLAQSHFEDPLFKGLWGGEHILVIENFAEIWFHQDQLFALSKL
ncbi:MAG: hypothetical protein Q7U04_01850 [Bacteriovorax sp.]|nr:hypothetical protein [Bacteriovorax sp.]